MSDQSHPHENPYRPPQSSEPPVEDPPASAFEAVGRRFIRLLGERGSALTGVWVLISVFNLGMFALTAAIQYKTGAGVFDFEMLQDPAAMNRYAETQQFSLLSLLSYPLMWISGGLYFAGFRPMRVIETEGRGPVDFSQARAEMFSNFGSVMGSVFIYGLAIGFGMMCCLLPGLIAAVVLLAAPYMVAVLGSSVFGSLSSAIEWFKRHWLLLCTASAVSLLLALFISTVSFLTVPVMSGAFGDAGIFIANGCVWLLGSIVGYFSWLFTGSVLVTIDLAEDRHFGAH